MAHGPTVPVMIAIALVGLFFYVAIGSLIYAIFLRLAIRWVAEKETDFGNAFLTSLFSILANCGVTLVLMVPIAVIAESGYRRGIELMPLMQVILLPIQFLVQSWIIQIRTEISFGKSCLVALLADVLVFIVAFALFMIFIIVSNSQIFYQFKNF